MDEASVTEFAYKAYNYVSNQGHIDMTVAEGAGVSATAASSSMFGSYMEMVQSAVTYLYSMMSNLGGSSWGIAAIGLIGVMMLASIIATLKVIRMIFFAKKAAHHGVIASSSSPKHAPAPTAAKVVVAASALNSTRMRRIYAAIRIYLHAWFMDVKCRTIDLIKLLLRPLKTAIFVLRHIGSLTKMENVLQLDSFHVAGGAALNGLYTKEHAHAVCMHARTVMHTQTLTPEQQKMMAAIEMSILKASNNR